MPKHRLSVGGLPVFGFQLSDLYAFKLLNEHYHWATTEFPHLPNECRTSDGANASVCFRWSSQSAGNLMDPLCRVASCAVALVYNVRSTAITA